MTLTNCAVTGNTGFNGGGVENFDNTVALTNCTVSGNNGGEGGGLENFAGTATLTNCTVSGNAANDGGGVRNYAPNNATATLALTNTIVAGNDASDVSGNYTGSNNLIGVNPLLSPLGNYGGPTPTMALLPGSPAIGSGTTTGAPVLDQRGEPRAGHVDIGAFQSQGFTLKPVAGCTPQSAAAGTKFASPLAVTVTALNPVEPVDGGIISFAVTPVDGASATLSAATATIAGGVASVTATANTTIGTYIVTATASGALPNGFVLTNIAAPSLTLASKPGAIQDVDSLTSLRAAIAYANSHSGPDTIIFDPAVSGKARRTITLSGGPLVLTNPATTTIIGPGADLLTLSGGGKSRVFDIEGGSLVLEGLTITDGRADRGGGILNDGGTLALDDVVLRGNRARVGGGLFNDGTTTMTHVVIRDNTTRVGSGPVQRP